jgi:pSer/pThr/pTyr-binding forkhead associated (FHA) protein
MRFRYVSKLHARFMLRDGLPISLEDSGSSNGTGINGKKLKAGTPVHITPGDKLSFGSLVVELMEPESLHLLLRRRVVATHPPSSGTG